jgi:hypothetical protein
MQKLIFTICSYNKQGLKVQHEEDELSYPSLFQLGFSSSGAYPRCGSSLFSHKGPVWLMAAAHHDPTVARRISCVLKGLHPSLCIPMLILAKRAVFVFFRHTCGAVRLVA